MRFMVVGHWDSTSPLLEDLVAAEQRRSGELAEEGFVRRLELRADGSGGFLLVEAATAETAIQRLETLPFVKNGLMTFELAELAL